MVSTLSGPIPPHPHYETPDNKFVVHNAGRTRPEAQEYAIKGRGSVGALLAIEGQSVGPMSAPARKQKPESKDHVKENVRRMRQIQRETKRLQEEGSKPVKALWKSSKFEGVQSRVKEDLHRQQEESQSRPSSANFLRAHSRTGMTPPPPRSRPPSADPKQRRPATPTADTAREMNLKRNDFDFVKMNGMAARHAGMRRSPSLTALDDLKKRQEDTQTNYKKGEVPKYLRQRQEQWSREEEERRAAIPDPEMPPGHRQMGNDERLETLKKLQSTQHELQCKMASLPVRTDTVHIRRQKAELERQMSEVDEAIKIFSRPKVFVRLDT